MRHIRIARCLALLLAVVLTVGLLPTIALAGPNDEPIYEVYVSASYPLAGAHPNFTGLAQYDEDPYTVDEVHFFEVDGDGNPVGKFLDESYTFVANQTYACQVILKAKEYNYFDENVEGWINFHYGETSLISDKEAAVLVYFTCAPGTVTVTFDANGSEDAPPAPIQVPIGATVWDVIRNFDDVRMSDKLWEQFYDWSLDPFATDFGAYYPFDNPVTQDLTLYAMWIPCERTVELWVELPEDCLVNDVDKPTVTVPANASYSIHETENFFIGLVDGNLHPDLVYTMPLQKGVTYYSRVIVSVPAAGQLPDVILHGAEVVNVRTYFDWGLEIIFSVTPQAGDTLTKADVFIDTPRAGQNAITAHPVVTCLTPGVHAGVQGWFDSSELGTEIYDGNLEGGKTYYALVYVGDDTGKYILSADKLQLNVEGKNVQTVRKVDLSDSMPNYVGVVVAVTIDKEYTFTADVPNGGGKIRCNRENQKWVSTMDFSSVPEGSLTVEAKADPDHMFKCWYDAETYEMLSKEPTYTFTLDRNRHIRASFVEKLPFVDVGAWDYFYEAVNWAIHHEPVITGGVDASHFGPKQNCTREQIMTFLWKANNEPGHASDENPFPDVKPGKYYYDAVLWAVENGITGGMSDGRFGVGVSCTRAQAMTFLWASKGRPEPETTENPFTDVKPGSWYYKAILWAVENHVTGGVGDGTRFGVDMICTRAQIITFLYKVYGPKG